jgi:hypothetical protein
LRTQFSKDLTINLPKWTLKNGTLVGYVVITEKKNLNKSLLALRPDTQTYLKEITLSKYQLNNTQQFINLLDPKIKAKDSTETPNVTPSSKNTKPITHLLKKINIFTLERHINFIRNQIPEEIVGDIV